MVLDELGVTIPIAKKNYVAISYRNDLFCCNAFILKVITNPLLQRIYCTKSLLQ